MYFLASAKPRALECMCMSVCSRIYLTLRRVCGLHDEFSTIRDELYVGRCLSIFPFPILFYMHMHTQILFLPNAQHTYTHTHTPYKRLFNFAPNHLMLRLALFPFFCSVSLRVAFIHLNCVDLFTSCFNSNGSNYISSSLFIMHAQNTFSVLSGYIW